MTIGYDQHGSESRETGLSSAEVQALLGSPYFQHIDRYAVIRAGSKIFRTSETNVEGWRQLSGSDKQNIFVCLLSNLNHWVNGLELSRTPGGGHMQMRNVRLLELASGKSVRGGRETDENGNEWPCLEDVGLSVCCAMVRGPQGRPWSFFRICHTDEVPRRDGKKIPYKPPIAAKLKPSRQPKGERVPLQQPAAAPTQSVLFTQESPAWIDPEMSRKGER